MLLSGLLPGSSLLLQAKIINKIVFFPQVEFLQALLSIYIKEKKVKVYVYTGFKRYRNLMKNIL